MIGAALDEIFPRSSSESLRAGLEALVRRRARLPARRRRLAGGRDTHQRPGTGGTRSQDGQLPGDRRPLSGGRRRRVRGRHRQRRARRFPRGSRDPAPPDWPPDSGAEGRVLVVGAGGPGGGFVVHHPHARWGLSFRRESSETSPEIRPARRSPRRTWPRAGKHLRSGVHQTTRAERTSGSEKALLPNESTRSTAVTTPAVTDSPAMRQTPLRERSRVRILRRRPSGRERVASTSTA